jgi:hypothetical protein
MTDLITRLHTAVITEVNPIDELTYPTSLGREAADEIERLRAAKESIALAEAKCFADLQHARQSGDPEYAHSEADAALCVFLDALGYQHLTAEWREVDKWYA